MGKKKSQAFRVRDLGPYRAVMIESTRIRECMEFYVKDKTGGQNRDKTGDSHLFNKKQ